MVSTPQPVCSMSKITYSAPATAAMRPMPVLANSKTMVPSETPPAFRARLTGLLLIRAPCVGGRLLLPGRPGEAMPRRNTSVARPQTATVPDMEEREHVHPLSASRRAAHGRPARPARPPRPRPVLQVDRLRPAGAARLPGGRPGCPAAGGWVGRAGDAGRTAPEADRRHRRP